MYFKVFAKSNNLKNLIEKLNRLANVSNCLFFYYFRLPLPVAILQSDSLQNIK